MNSNKNSLFSFFLFAGASQLVLALLSLVYEILGLAGYILSYPLILLHSALSAVFLAISLGASLYEAVKGEKAKSLSILFIATGAGLLGGFIGLLAETLVFESYIETLGVLQLIGTVLDTVAIPLFLLFAIAYIPFLRKAEEVALPERLFDLSNPLSRASLTAAAALTLYKLIGQIISTVNFVQSTFGIFLDGEIAMILLDFLLLFAEGFLVYYFTLFSTKKALEFSERSEESEE